MNKYEYQTGTAYTREDVTVGWGCPFIVRKHHHKRKYYIWAGAKACHSAITTSAKRAGITEDQMFQWSWRSDSNPNTDDYFYQIAGPFNSLKAASAALKVHFVTSGDLYE
jgi:hypothetical protein